MNNKVLSELILNLDSFSVSVYDLRSIFMNFINSTICDSVMEHLNYGTISRLRHDSRSHYHFEYIAHLLILQWPTYHTKKVYESSWPER